MKTYFINYMYDFKVENRETVDETNKYKDALYLVNEYRISDRDGKYYISQRCCQNWNAR